MDGNFKQTTFKGLLFWGTLLYLILLVGMINTVYAEGLSAELHYTDTADSYLLEPGDVLSFQVLHEPDYTQPEIVIQPDGLATFPGVGLLQVQDMSTEELTKQLTEKLSRTLVNPEVLVSIKQTRPGAVYLSGSVEHPGMVQLITDTQGNNFQMSGTGPVAHSGMRLTNILANAGGVKPEADLSHVQVKRTHSGKTVTVDLWKLLKGGDEDQDVLLNPGDSVYIPEAAKMALSDAELDLLLRSSIGPKTFPVRIIGEVGAPGVYEIDARSPLLNTILAKAGGFAPQANRSAVAIRRFSTDDSFSTLFLNPNKQDIHLRPNDVVFIAENKLYKSGRYMEQVQKVLSPFQTASITAAGAAQVFGFGGWNKVTTTKITN